MSSYEKEMVLFYTNLWGSTGQPTFSPVSLETMAEKNNNSALMLFFIHHLKGEEGNVINACKKVLNYVRPETPGSDIFEELPKFGHFKDMSVQTDMKKPMALSFPSMDGKAGGKMSIEDYPLLTSLFEPKKKTDETPQSIEELSSDDSSVSQSLDTPDTEVPEVPEVTGIFDKEIREFKKMRAICGKVPTSGQIYFTRFFMESDFPENIVFLTSEQIPDIKELKRGSIFSLSGKFKYIEGKKNWVLNDDSSITLERLKINGIQQANTRGNSLKTVLCHRGIEYFVSDKERLPSDGPCTFELYKESSRESYSACNLKAIKKV